MSYNVFHAIYEIRNPLDPDHPIYHHSLLVGTKGDDKGQIHHVDGNFIQGMRYETKPGSLPKGEKKFCEPLRIGCVKQSDYP